MAEVLRLEGAADIIAGMDYGLIIALLAYFGALQLSTKFNTTPLVNTIVAVILPYLVRLVVQYIYVSGYGLPVVENLFSIQSILLVMLQFVVGYGLFYKLQNDESIGAWMAWAVFGFLVIYFALPFLVVSVLG